MKTTRVGGGHPGYLVREDPNPDDAEAPRKTAQQDLWHYTIARMVDACVTHGILPFYGPFGDIQDREGYLSVANSDAALGFEGKWAIHPSQIELAHRVFTPSDAEVTQARRILDAMREAAVQVSASPDDPQGGGSGIGSAVVGGAMGAIQFLLPLAAKAFMPLPF